MISKIGIDLIKPAPYNPRKISEKQIEILKQSVIELGMILPILVNKKNNTIIAGHQRTKACRAAGIKQVPVIFIDGIEIGDEIKFNQIHNAIDRSEKVKTILKCNYDFETFLEINNLNFIIGDTSPAYIKEICKLINKYGNSLSCVVCKKEVFIGENYIKACQLLGLNVNIYICSDDKYELLKKYIYQDYGQYSYDGIKRNTFVQGLAQLYRSTTKKEGKKQQASSLYENCVIPYLNKNKSTLLDFGCGKGDYIDMLSKKYDAHGIEFFNNNGKSIIVSKGNQLIDELIHHIKDNGVFDVVVCDSVLNSVDSIEAEESVITCLNLFCKDKLFISGRPLDSVTNKYNLKTDRYNAKRYLEFLDENNFSANFRQGKWYFQHYHTKEQITKMLEKLGFKIDKLHWCKFGDSFQAECTKIKQLTNEQYIKAVEFEFNLPLPNGRSYNRDKEVIKLMSLN